MEVSATLKIRSIVSSSCLYACHTWSSRFASLHFYIWIKLLERSTLSCFAEVIIKLGKQYDCLRN